MTNDIDYASWFSAIATLFAVLVALYIPHKQMERDRLSKFNEINMRLYQSSTLFFLTGDCLKKINIFLDSGVGSADFIRNSNELISDLDFLMIHIENLSIYDMPDQISIKYLAVLVSSINSLKEKILGLGQESCKSSSHEAAVKSLITLEANNAAEFAKNIDEAFNKKIQENKASYNSGGLPLDLK
ncbi:MAG: hypothetical protein AABY68_01900 [Pseudomonadota bacterium]